MIVVNAIIEVDASTLSAMREAIITMEDASRAEDGCLDYTFSQELRDPNTLRITEAWRSMEDLAAHFATPHMATFQAAMAAHPPKRVDAKFFDATEVQAPGQ